MENYVIPKRDWYSQTYMEETVYLDSNQRKIKFRIPYTAGPM